MNSETKITVIGAGGAGGRAINHLMTKGMDDISFVAADTDPQDLEKSQAPSTFLLHSHSNDEELTALISASDFLCVIAGMGGRSAIKIVKFITQIAAKHGVQTITILSAPFRFEGWNRRKRAQRCIEHLEKTVDSLVLLNNPKLQILHPSVTSPTALFQCANEYFYQIISAFHGLLQPGILTVDLADISAMTKQKGAVFVGFGRDENLSVATEAALYSLLLDDISIPESQVMLVQFSSTANHSLLDIHQAMLFIQDHAHEDVNIIFGWTVDEVAGDSVSVTIFASDLLSSFAHPLQE